jgi:putative phage-type endonuclease
MEQRSDEWFNARLGCVTASRTADVMAKTKSGTSASRANYMAQLITQRLTGTASEGLSSAAMQWGTDTEPQARTAYELMTGETVEETGFVLHPTIEFFGASPDGLVRSNGLIEIKCPNTATHINTLLSDTVPSKYITQMQVQMICTGREWCDFVSFDPRLPGDMCFWMQRVDRDEDICKDIEAEVISFLAEIDSKIDKLRENFGGLNNVDNKTIIETFERIEEEAGGLCNTSPSVTLDMTAIKLGLSKYIVRRVMINHWS